MSEQKRKNFSKQEKEMLISIILNNKETIENKKTCSTTLAEKENCWKSIAEQFNCASSVPRTTTQIKAFYKNAKSDLKKRIAANRASIFRTGGGRQESHLNEDDPLLSIVLEQTQTVENPFDSSHELFEAVDNVVPNEVLDSPETQSSSTAAVVNRRKRPREPTRLEEERHILFKEVLEMKKQKIAADIEKSKLKSEVYKSKLEILKKFKENNNSK